MKKRIIIVSNRLPVNITEEEGSLTLHRSNGGLATALSTLMDGDEYDVKWIGWSGAKSSISPRKLKKAGWDKRLLPVALRSDLVHGYYERMSNGILWPVLHGMPPNLMFDQVDWQSYVTANRQFVKAIKQVIAPNDIIWIHDYHLLMVPQFLREAGIANKVGFFLHTPLASVDRMAALPTFTSIISSLAQVDVLGFQTEEDARTFDVCLARTGDVMRSSSTVGVFPIGVDAEAYQQAADKPAVQREMTKVRARLRDKRAILSVSRLDYTKGVPEQLRAVEAMLERCKDPTSIVYKLIVAPSREDVAGYRELKELIEKEVGRINARFSNNGAGPIDYTYRSVGFDELHAWYQLSDVMLTTPIIDGMNLVVKEYIAARDDKPGMLIMSDTIGAARQLQAALLVAPKDILAMTAALLRALTIDPTERSLRWSLLSGNVQNQDVQWWLREFLSALESKTQMILASQQVHHPRMRIAKRLPHVRLLRLARNKQVRAGGQL